MPAELLRSQGRRRYSDTNGQPPKLEEPDWDENGDPLWTPGGHAAIMLSAIAGCAHLETAARMAGIHRNTWRTWRTRGEKQQERIERGDPLEPAEARYFHFLCAVDRAEADLEGRLTARWHHLAGDDWRAIERLTAKRFRATWGDTQHVEVTGPEGGPVRVDVMERLEAHFAQIAERLRAAGEV